MQPRRNKEQVHMKADQRQEPWLDGPSRGASGQEEPRRAPSFNRHPQPSDTCDCCIYRPLREGGDTCELQKYLALLLLLASKAPPSSCSMCRRKGTYWYLLGCKDFLNTPAHFPLGHTAQPKSPHPGSQTHAFGNQIPANNQIFLGDSAVPWQHWKQSGKEPVEAGMEWPLLK